MRRVLKACFAGFLYFVAVFAVGFCLGTFRVLVEEPVFGRTISVALEIPVMLAVCWFAARALVTRLSIPAMAFSRLAMGGFAVATLVLAEALLGKALGQSFSDQASAYASARGLFTIVGQVGFALMPLLLAIGQRGTAKRSERSD